jgi:putative ABC transport system permease protein
VATAALPGVTSVSTTSLLPMRGEGQVNFVVPAGRVLSGAERPSANYRFVDPNYFATLDLPLQRGRSFARADRDGRRLTPVVVSASLVRRLWPGDNPLGREFSRGVDGEPGFEIVGVAVDAQTTSADTPPPDMVYLPYWWQPRLSASLLVQTAQAPDGVVAMVRRAVADVDPQIAIGRVERLDDIVASATAGRWYQVRLFVAFGACAAAIATLGVYSVAAFAIARRRREMNLRIALGAPPSAIFGLLFRDTGAGVAAGIAAGLLGALLLGNAVAGVLYAVSPRDPLVLVTVAAGIAVSALATIVVAWRRELCVDPAAALRAE